MRRAIPRAGNDATPVKIGGNSFPTHPSGGGRASRTATAVRASGWNRSARPNQPVPHGEPTQAPRALYPGRRAGRGGWHPPLPSAPRARRADPPVDALPTATATPEPPRRNAAERRPRPFNGQSPPPPPPFPSPPGPVNCPSHPQHPLPPVPPPPTAPHQAPGDGGALPARAALRFPTCRMPPGATGAAEQQPEVQRDPDRTGAQQHQPVSHWPPPQPAPSPPRRPLPAATGRLGRPWLLPAPPPPLGQAGLRYTAAAGSCSPAPAPAGSGGAGGGGGRLQPPQCRGAAPGSWGERGRVCRARRRRKRGLLGGGSQAGAFPRGETPREHGFTSRFTWRGSVGVGGRGEWPGTVAARYPCGLLPSGEPRAGLLVTAPATLGSGRRPPAGLALAGAGHPSPVSLYLCNTTIISWMPLLKKSSL